MTHTAVKPTPPPQEHRTKQILFCPECNEKDTINAWYTDTPGGTVLHCPTCDYKHTQKIPAENQ